MKEMINMTKQEMINLYIEALKVLTKDSDEEERRTIRKMLVIKLENL